MRSQHSLNRAAMRLCASDCATSAMSNASWRASRCARRGLATSRSCAPRWRHCPPLRAPWRTRLAAARTAARANRRSRGEYALLARAIEAEPAHLLRDGGVIATGYDARSMSCARIASHTDDFLLELERRERERTGIAVSSSATTACRVSTSKSRAPRPTSVPADYQRRQTIRSAERFVTPELQSFEDRVLRRTERALARERELYEALLSRLIEALPALQTSADALGQLDALAALAQPRRRAAGASRNSSRSRACCSRRRVTRWSKRFIEGPFVAQRSVAARSAPHADHHRARTWAANRPTCARSR